MKLSTDEVFILLANVMTDMAERMMEETIHGDGDIELSELAVVLNINLLDGVVGTTTEPSYQAGLMQQYTHGLRESIQMISEHTPQSDSKTVMPVSEGVH